MWVSKIRAGGADRSVFGSFWFTPTGSLASSGARVTPALAMGLTEVYACVRVLAQSFAVMDFQLFLPKAGGGRTKQTNHWLYRLFAKAPNRFQSPFEWRMMLMGHLALRGNAYCQIGANAKGEIVELLPLHPDRMTMQLLESGSYRYVYSDLNGQQIFYTRDEIWHLRGLSDDGYMGMSPIQMARESVAESMAMQSYSSRFFANDTKPGGGWIEYPGGFASSAAKLTFRESWQQMQGGANRGKVAVLEKGMKYHELGLNNKDSQFIEARAAKVTEIARLFGVPPHKIADLSRSTNNNIEHQSIEFWTDTMLPWSKCWASSICFFLLGVDTEFEPIFDMSKMMRGDAASRGTYYNTGIMAGWLTRNEAREEEGLDPIDGLDEPMRPLNMIGQNDGVDVVPDADDAPPASDTPPTRPAPAQEKADARLNAIVKSSAARMAKRIAGGQALSAEVLSDALAIEIMLAQAWLDGVGSLLSDESEIAAALEALALKDSQ